jgi:endonuclease YncB( thermonuclease family)
MRRALGCLSRYASFGNCNIDEKKQSKNMNALAIPEAPIEWNKTTAFIPPVKEGLVIKVYDGDTITIASKLPYEGSPLYRFSVRLNGIDCPEIHGINEDEKHVAQIAKKELENLILQKRVVLKNLKTEKYGRILADVYYNDIHVNKWMLDKNLAVVYDGGTKHSPDCWVEYYKNGIFSNKI